MILTTNALDDKGMFLEKYTSRGANISPAISWSDAPAGTQSYALIIDDPDAPIGIFIHWVAFNIPATQTAIREGDSAGLTQGVNGYGDLGYGGPCPPDADGPHQYFFTVYALDTLLDAEAGIDKSTLERAMEGHILEQASVVGTYEVI